MMELGKGRMFWGHCKALAQSEDSLQADHAHTSWVKKRLGQQEDVTRESRLRREAEFLDQQLQQGYQEEALFLRRTMEITKQQYLMRLQMLELELSVAELQRDRARRRSRAARAEWEALLQENRSLIQTLHQVRKTLEQTTQQRQQAALKSCATPVRYITTWKRVHQHKPHWPRS